jgi:hypothetical protein
MTIIYTYRIMINVSMGEETRNVNQNIFSTRGVPCSIINKKKNSCLSLRGPLCPERISLQNSKGFFTLINEQKKSFPKN